jgi:hypothetical protein
LLFFNVLTLAAVSPTMQSPQAQQKPVRAQIQAPTAIPNLFASLGAPRGPVDEHTDGGGIGESQFSRPSENAWDTRQDRISHLRFNI